MRWHCGIILGEKEDGTTFDCVRVLQAVEAGQLLLVMVTASIVDDVAYKRYKDGDGVEMVWFKLFVEMVNKCCEVVSQCKK